MLKPLIATESGGSKRWKTCLRFGRLRMIYTKRQRHGSRCRSLTKASWVPLSIWYIRVCMYMYNHAYIYIYMYKYHIPHPNHAWLTVPLLLHNMNPWSLVSSSRSRRPKRSVHQTQVCFKKNPAYVKVRLLFGPLGPIFLRLNTVLLLGLYALQLRAHSRLCRLEGWARTHSVPACVILLGDSPGCNKGKS